MVIRFELKLKNNNKIKYWIIWKEQESRIRDFATQFGIDQFDLEYDDVKYVKKVSLRYDSEKKLAQFQTAASIDAGNHGLEFELISRIMLEHSIFESSEKTIKFLIKLIDPTKINWEKFRNSELHIKKIEEELNIKRISSTFNHEESTISLQLIFPETKSREILSSKITSYLDSIGIKQEIIEAIEIKGIKEDIIDLQLYKANKLMDQVDQSLRKLSKM